MKKSLGNLRCTFYQVVLREDATKLLSLVLSGACHFRDFLLSEPQRTPSPTHIHTRAHGTHALTAHMRSRHTRAHGTTPSTVV